ncbi:MAG TPA: TRAM domain-containing protein, partial [Spirochaetia bacterium]|nr:TRAM domain-containing protein [Spirochaetia bacterium]
MSELEIQKLVAGGDGLAFADGKAVFVPGVLPGERVRVRVASRRRDYDRAILEEVLVPSPARVKPPCRLAGICGGCDWLHIDPQEQRNQKLAILRESLRRTGHVDLPDLAVEAGPELGYRNRVQLHRSSTGRLGYMAAESARVIEVEECPVAAPSVNTLFGGTVPPPEGLDRFIAFGGDGWVAREGADDARDLEVVVAGKRILFSVGCFFQSNLAALQSLVPYVLEGL